VAFVLSQVWLFTYNIFTWGHWSGPPFFVNGTVNQDGLFGCLANVTRYFVESFHLTSVFDLCYEKVTGKTFSGLVQGGYDTFLQPIFAEVALANPFRVNWNQTEDTWYGPIGFFVAWIGAPAAFAFRRSPARILAILGFVFFFIVSYKIKWWVSNQRYLVCFFVLATIASAPLLERVWKRPLARWTFVAVSVVIGVHALLFNVTKPFFHFLSPRIDLMVKDSVLDGTNVWSQTKWGKKAWWPHDVGDWADLDLRGKTIGIVASNHHDHFTFLMAHRDARFIGIAHDAGLPPEQYERIFSNDELKVANLDYVLFLRVEHEFIIGKATALRIDTPGEETTKTIPILPAGRSLGEVWHYFPDGPGKPSFRLYEVKESS
jgi:hypothetical protein